MYVYIYIYIYIHIIVCIHIYIYIYIEREREINVIFRNRAVDRLQVVSGRGATAGRLGAGTLHPAQNKAGLHRLSRKGFRNSGTGSGRSDHPRRFINSLWAITRSPCKERMRGLAQEGEVRLRNPNLEHFIHGRVCYTMLYHIMLYYSTLSILYYIMLY